MADPLFLIGRFLSILDYVGTAVFAVTCPPKAIKHRADILGMIVLADVVGTAGGIA